MSELVHVRCHECGNSSQLEPSEIEFHFMPKNEQQHKRPLSHAVAQFTCSVAMCEDAHDPNFTSARVLELSAQGSTFVLLHQPPLLREVIPQPEMIAEPITDADIEQFRKLSKLWLSSDYIDKILSKEL